MKIDFHVHTKYSYDSLMSPDKIIERAKKRGLDGVVICDHNTIKGALETIKINKHQDFVIIPAAEIYTDVGDITGLFIKREIKERAFDKVVSEIKFQGGFVLLNHPYSHHKLENIDFSKIDFIEGYNSRLDEKDNDLAVKLAKKYDIPILSGSDAHCYNEIGNSFTIVENLNPIIPQKNYNKKSPFVYVTLSQYIKAVKQRRPDIFISATKIFIKKLFGKISLKRV